MGTECIPVRVESTNVVLRLAKWYNLSDDTFGLTLCLPKGPISGIDHRNPSGGYPTLICFSTLNLPHLQHDQS